MTDPTLRERLRNSIEDDRLVLFCGAGLSMERPSQVPSVAELARICSETYALDYSTVLPDDVATDLEKMAEYFLAKTLLVPTFVNRLIPRGPFLYPQQIIWDKRRALVWQAWRREHVDLDLAIAEVPGGRMFAKPEREKSTSHIDGMSAITNAMARAMLGEQNVYSGTVRSVGLCCRGCVPLTACWITPSRPPRSKT